MVRLTAEQWQLYTKTMQCDDVAKAINNKLNERLKNAKERIKYFELYNVDVGRDLYKEMFVFLAKHAKYGAIDTEPRGVMARTIEKELRLPDGTIEP